MSKKLYVGGLSYQTTKESLSELFTNVGKVATVSIITDFQTGRSKGFGFVEMADDADAQSAIETYNGKEFEGRTLVVNEARDKPSSGARNSGFRR